MPINVGPPSGFLPELGGTQTAEHALPEYVYQRSPPPQVLYLSWVANKPQNMPYQNVSVNAGHTLKVST